MKSFYDVFWPNFSISIVKPALLLTAKQATSEKERLCNAAGQGMALQCCQLIWHENRLSATRARSAPVTAMRQIVYVAYILLHQVNWEPQPKRRNGSLQHNFMRQGMWHSTSQQCGTARCKNALPLCSACTLLTFSEAWSS